MAELTTPAEYARMRKRRGLPGGSKVAVHKAIKTGRLTLVDGKLDPDQADRDWVAKTNAKQQRAGKAKAPARTKPEKNSVKEGSSEKGSVEKDSVEKLADAQARKETALANLREMEEAQKRGELIPVAEAETNRAQIGTRIRDEVSAIPTRVVNRLPDEWRREVFSVLSEETRKALTALSDEFRTD